jgi:hypothetical protein
MIPVAQAAIVVCVVVVSGVLVAALLALRRTALRAESVLSQIERELRPLMSQVEALSSEVRQLASSANEELRRVSIVVRRADDVTAKLARLLGTVAAFTSVGQYASVAAGLKKGVDVFVKRLRAKN